MLNYQRVVFRCEIRTKSSWISSCQKPAWHIEWFECRKIFGVCLDFPLVSNVAMEHSPQREVSKRKIIYKWWTFNCHVWLPEGRLHPDPEFHPLNHYIKNPWISPVFVAKTPWPKKRSLHRSTCCKLHHSAVLPRRACFEWHLQEILNVTSGFWYI